MILDPIWKYSKISSYEYLIISLTLKFVFLYLFARLMINENNLLMRKSMRSHELTFSQRITTIRAKHQGQKYTFAFCIFKLFIFFRDTFYYSETQTAVRHNAKCYCILLPSLILKRASCHFYFILAYDRSNFRFVENE